MRNTGVRSLEQDEIPGRKNPMRTCKLKNLKKLRSFGFVHGFDSGNGFSSIFTIYCRISFHYKKKKKTFASDPIKITRLLIKKSVSTASRRLM